MTQEIQTALTKLKNCEGKLTDLIKEMSIGLVIKPIDIYSMAIVNRSLALINGFEVMLISNNYHGAVHLVRLHLDSLLRYAALWMVADSNAFIRAVMTGVCVSSLTDKNGRKMTDKHLKEVVAADYPWVENVYEQTSGFVHFSHKHIAFSTKVTNEQAHEVQHAIRREDTFVEDESRLEAIEEMVAISDCIADYLGWWIISKNDQPKPSEE